MKDLNIDLYRKMFLIRRCEEQIAKYYSDDEMKTPMHMSMGSEAISVGLCHAMAVTDQIFGTYRSHGIYLAKTEDLDDFFAEMYGKDTALLKGKGGSMHLCAPDHGLLGTSAIVASVIPVALGVAFANKISKNGTLTTVFFGDGAIDEGVFWESINVASLMKLPVLLVCEDNDYAVHSPKRIRHGYKDISEVVSGFDCDVIKDEGTDVENIYNLSKKIRQNVLEKSRPCFMHLQYYRYLEHVGVNADFDAGYRSKSDFDKWYKKDPINHQRKKLINMGLDENYLSNLEDNISEKILKAIEKAKSASFPADIELLREVC